MTSKQLANKICESLSTKKTEKICIIDLQNEPAIADFIIITSATSSTAVKAIADLVEFDMEKLGERVLRKDGTAESLWIVVDFGNVILHIFGNELRDFYNLEKLWSKGKNMKVFEEKTETPKAKVAIAEKAITKQVSKIDNVVDEKKEPKSKIKTVKIKTDIKK